MTDTTREFILSHRECDVRQLALQASRYPEVDMPTAIHQIAGWQQARHKLPSWAACDDIIYPPHLALEQCSSEHTARYKASLAQRLVNLYAKDKSTTSMADMTGGLGVDFAFLSTVFDHATYIEQQSELCQCARHNFTVLGLNHTDVIEANSLEALSQLTSVTMLMADPARRSKSGSRTYAISDCTPDILPILPQLMEKADFMLLKLSPMLDWHQAVDSIQRTAGQIVREIHIVAVANECKELLLVLSAQTTDKPIQLFCANDQQLFMADAQTTHDSVGIATPDEAMQAAWIYEPNAAIMKAGSFAAITQQYGIKALAPNSHLFVSTLPIKDFPGRQLRVEKVTTMNKKVLRESLHGITKANISVRNFPLTAQQLKHQLKLSDGGDIYLLASTLCNRQHVIFVCFKN